jgi:hypothetical protein
MSPNTAIDMNQLCEEVLSDGADDYFGLYEIIWSLNGHYPGLSRDQKLALTHA